MIDEPLSETLQTTINVLKQKIIERGRLPYISIQEQLKYVDELSQFPLGKALLEKKSIDTFWTDYIVAYSGQKKYSDLEDFILNRSPMTKAWRELLLNFQKITQAHLKDEIILTSIPCGAMRELLDLDYSHISDFKIIGIDIDPDSLLLAHRLAEQRGLTKNLFLYPYDAWQLPYDSELDLITSCGLNIYVSDQQKTLDLYRQFLKALKRGGKLITSFLTYPPNENEISEWQINGLSSRDLMLEKILYKDILDAQWRNFRTSNAFEAELKEAGFSEVTFYYDKMHVFPTVIAKN